MQNSLRQTAQSAPPGLAQRPAAQLLIALSFFCLVTPLALLERLRRRDRLGLRLERWRTSYWLARTSRRSSQHVYDPY